MRLTYFDFSSTVERDPHTAWKSTVLLTQRGSAFHFSLPFSGTLLIKKARSVIVALSGPEGEC